MTIDTTPPDPPVVYLDYFVTAKNGTILTNKIMPTIEGTAEPSAVLVIKIKGLPDILTKVNEQGKWQHTFLNPLEDGPHSINLIAKDAAGNESTAKLYDFTIKSTILKPTAELHAEDDSGTKKDWITQKDTDVRLKGTSEPDAKITIFLNGKSIGTPEVDEEGFWHFTIPGRLSEDKHDIKVLATDLLDQTSAVIYPLIIDTHTVVPTVTLHESSDSGIKNDSITNVKKPMFRGTAEVGAEITLFINGELRKEKAVTSKDGNWTLSLDDNLPEDGIYQIMVQAKDVADNQATSSTYAFTLITSTEKPTIELSVKESERSDLQENLINNNRPTLKGTAAPHAVITLYTEEQGLINSTKANDKGYWEYELKSGEKLLDGDYTFYAKVKDIADNQATSDSLTVKIDTEVTIDSVELVDNNASEPYKKENLTNTKTPLFKITVPSDVVKVEVSLDGGKKWISVDSAHRQEGQGDGARDIWTYKVPDSLEEKQHRLLVKVTDKAKNISPEQMLTFTVDTELNTPSITLDQHSDSGANTEDNFTNITKPLFNIIGIDVDVTVVTIIVRDNDNKSIETIIATRIVKGNPLKPEAWDIAVIDAAGKQIKPHSVQLKLKEGSSESWEIKLNNALQDGKHSLMIETQDRAGNNSSTLPDNKKPLPLDIEIDTEINIPILTLDPDSDKSDYDVDNITNEPNPMFNLAHIDDDVVQIIINVQGVDNGTVKKIIASRSVTGSPPSPGEWEVTSKNASLHEGKGNNWQIKLSEALEHGKYTLSVAIEDRTGNKIDDHSSDKAKPLDIEIDTELNVPTITLNPSKDTEAESNTTLTNEKKPPFTLTNIDDDVTSLSITVTGNDPKNNRTLTATRKDKEAPWNLDKEAGTLVIEGNKLIFTPTVEWKDDVYTLNTAVKDRAGNEKDAVTIKVTVDSTPPDQPTLTLDQSSDTGDKNDDNITNASNPIFIIGNINEKDNVTRFEIKVEYQKEENDNKTLLGDVLKAQKVGEQWQLHVNEEGWQDDGIYTLTLIAIDQAGNRSEASEALQVTIDRTPPGSPSIELDSESNTGQDGFKDQNLTNKNPPELTLKKIDPDVSKIVITVDEDKKITATRTEDGKDWQFSDPVGAALKQNDDKSWLLTLPKDYSLSEGSSTLQVHAYDQAGNKSVDNNQSKITLTVDTTLPHIPEITLVASVDTAKEYKNTLTKNQTPEFTLQIKDKDLSHILVTKSRKGENGFEQVGEEETIKVTNIKEGTLTFKPNGIWNDGDYHLTVVAVDKAGNHSQEAGKIEITIDSEVTIGEIKLVDKTGDDPLENLTSVDKPTFHITVPDDVSTMQVSVDKGNTWFSVDKPQASNKGNNVWIYTFIDAIHTEKKAENYTLLVKVKDNAGNEADKDLSFTLDNQPPEKPTIELDSESNTGEVKNDNLSNQQKPFFNLKNIDTTDVTQIIVTVTDPKNTSTVLTFKKDATGTYVNSENNQSIQNDDLRYTPASEWENGNYTVKVEVKDKAGNQSEAAQQLVTINTKSPTEPQITLEPSSETQEGYKNKFTNKPQPDFKLDLIDIEKDELTRISITIKSLGERGETEKIEIRKIGEKWLLFGDNNKPVDTQPDPLPIIIKDNRQVSFRPSQDMQEGANELSVKVQNKAGNTSTSQLLNVIIDTEAPEASSIELVTSEDTEEGSQSTLTKDNPPSFTLQDIAEDTTRLIISIKSEKKDDTITVMRQDNNSEWKITDNKKGTLAISGKDLIFTPNGNWVDDDYTLTLTTQDTAGNKAVPKELKIEVDTTPPAPPQLSLDPEDGKDNLTNKSQPTFIINNFREHDSDVTRFEVTLSYGRDNKQIKFSQDKDNEGNWKITPQDEWSQDGEYTLSVIAIDKAGNKSQNPGSLKVTLDTTPPQQPIIELSEESHTGPNEFAKQNITNENPPGLTLKKIDDDVNKIVIAINGGKESGGQTITATKNEKHGWDLDPSGATLTVGNGGPWRLVLTERWPQGASTLEVKAYDKAGNASTTLEEKLTIIVDTVLAIPSIATDEKTYENGQGSDNVTKNKTPIFTLKDIDQDVVAFTLTVEDNKGSGPKTVTATKSKEGNWTLTPSNLIEFDQNTAIFKPKNAWDDGVHTLTLEITDKAGNEQSSDPLRITINNVPPSIPVIELVESTETEAERQKDLTPDKAPKFRLKNIDDLTNKLVITIKGPGTEEKIITANKIGNNKNWQFEQADVALKEEKNGTWTLETPEKYWQDGDFTLDVTAYNQAGNKSEATQRKITVDTTAPDAPTIELNAGSFVKTGLFAEENWTKEEQLKFTLSQIVSDVTRITMTLTTENNSTKEIKATRASVGSDWTIITDTLPLKATLNKHGTLTLTGLSETKHTLTVQAQDTAGNKSDAGNPVIFQVDRTPPPVPTIELIPSEQTDETYKTTLTNEKPPSFKLGTLDADISIIKITVSTPSGGAEKIITLQRTTTEGEWQVNAPADLGAKLSENLETLIFNNKKQWKDGNYTLTLVTEDKAGNQSKEENKQSLSLTIDTDPPVAPTIELTKDSDSGVQGDNITKNTQPLFSGIAEKDSIVTVLIDGKEYGTATTDSQGNWVLLKADREALTDKKDYKVTAVAKDRAGNSSDPSEAVVLAIDTTVGIPVITLVRSEKTEDSAKDFLTNKQKPSFTLNNIDDDVNQIIVTVKGLKDTKDITVKKTGTTWQWVNEQGSNVSLIGKNNNKNSLTFIPPDDLDHGKYTLSVKVVDVADNLNSSGNLEIVVDLDPPQWPTIELDSSSKTGVGTFKGRDITNKKNPQFILRDIDEDVVAITITLDSGQKIEATRAYQSSEWKLVSKGATLIRNETDGWLLTLPDVLPQGVSTLSVSAKDRAGNLSEDHATSISTQLEVIFDNDPPPAPTIGMNEKSYSHDKNAKNATRIPKPMFDLSKIDGDVEQITLQIKGNGTVTQTIKAEKNEGGSWSIPPSKTPLVGHDGKLIFPLSNDLRDGDYTITVIAIDKAGNATDTVEAIKFIIDNQAPNTAEIALDKGSLGLEGFKEANHTKNRKPGFLFTVDEPDVTVEIQLNNSGKWIQVSKKENDQGGKVVWGYQWLDMLQEKEHQLKVKVTDLAGNVSKESTLDFTVDDTPPAKPGLVMDPTADNDTGISQTDGITKNKQPNFTLSSIDGNDVAKVDIQIFNKKTRGIETISIEKNHWSEKFTPTTGWSDGEYELTLVVYDKAGNKNESDKVTVTIDTTLNASVVMEDDKNKGTDYANEGALTNNKKPTFIITVDSDAVEFIVTVTNKNTKTEVATKTLSGQTEVTDKIKAGKFTVDPNDLFRNGDLTDDEYEIKIKVVDKAGNEKTVNQDFTLDTTVEKPTIELFDPKSISDETEKRTAKSLKPKFQGKTEPGAEVTIFIGDNPIHSGKVTANKSGDWIWEPSTSFKNNTNYVIKAQVKDRAGNESAEASFDLIVPMLEVPPPTFTLSELTDSGVLGDFITSNKTPTLEISTQGGIDVKIILAPHPGTTESKKEFVIPANENTDGKLRFTFPDDLADGEYQVSVSVYNPADEQDASTDKPLIIDTKVDDWEVTVAEMKKHQNDNYIKNNKIEVTGTAEKGSKIFVFLNQQDTTDNEKAFRIITVDKEGQWTDTLNLQKEKDGKHQLAFKIIDQAGNQDTKEIELNLDTQTVAIEVELSAVSKENEATPLTITNMGGNKDSAITNKERVSIKGTAEAGATLTITGQKNGQDLSMVVGDNGTWEVENLNLSEGEQTLIIKSVDKADNEVIRELVLTKDTTIKAFDIALSPESNTNSDKNSPALISSKLSPTLMTTETDLDATLTLIVTDSMGRTVYEQKNLEVNGRGILEHVIPQNAVASDGEYQIVLTAIDRAGNKVTKKESLTIERNLGGFTVNTDDLFTFKDENLTNNRTPTINGTGKQGATVKMIAIGSDGKEKVVGERVITNGNNWTITADMASKINYPEGQYKIKFVITDKASNSDEVVVKELNIDSEIVAPTVTLDDDSNSGLQRLIKAKASTEEQDEARLKPFTNMVYPTFKGTAEPGSEITLKIGNDRISPIKVGDKGDWSYTSKTPIKAGTYDVSVEATDKATNTKGSQGSFVVTMDTETWINTPVMAESSDRGGMYKDDNWTHHTNPTFIVRGEAGQKVIVMVNGEKDGEITATGNDQHYRLNTSLKEVSGKSHKISYIIEDLAGNTVTTDTLGFGVDTSNDIPIILASVDEKSIDAGEDFYINKNTQAQGVTLRGTAKPDSRITILVNGILITNDHTLSDKQGDWMVFVPAYTLTREGPISIKITSKSRGGYQQQHESTVIVDTQIETFTTELDDNRANENSTNWWSNTKNPIFKGSGERGAKVSLTFADKEYTAEVDEKGGWKIKVEDDVVTDGHHTINFKITDQAGNTKDETKQIEIKSTPPQQPKITATEHITLDGEGNIVLSGTGEAGTTIIIRDTNGNELTNPPVDKSGYWRSIMTRPEADSFTVESQDKMGNVSERLTQKIPPSVVLPEKKDEDDQEVEGAEGEKNVGVEKNEDSENNENLEITDTQGEETSPVAKEEDATESNVIEDTLPATDNRSIQLKDSADDQHTDSLQPTFVITPPEDCSEMQVLLDERELEVETQELNEQSIACTPLMPLSEGPHTLTVKFVDQQGGFSSAEKDFSIDDSSSDIVNTMDKNKAGSEQETSPPTKRGHRIDEAVESFIVESMIQPPIDEHRDEH